MNCRKCKEILKDIPQGFDAFSFLSSVKQMYCENEKCEDFGYVTVAGIPQKDLKEEAKEIKDFLSTIESKEI